MWKNGLRNSKIRIGKNKEWGIKKWRGGIEKDRRSFASAVFFGLVQTQKVHRQRNKVPLAVAMMDLGQLTQIQTSMASVVKNTIMTFAPMKDHAVTSPDVGCVAKSTLTFFENNVKLSSE